MKYIIPIISADIESSAIVDLRKIGAYGYTDHVATRGLMMAYHPVGSPEPPHLWLEGQPPPEDFISAVTAHAEFAGWNCVGFDRLMYNRILVPRHGFPPIDDDRWRDSMHLAAAANLPRSLDGCARAVGVEHVAELKDSNRIRRITDANRTPIPATVAEILGDPGRFDAKLVDDLRWLAARCVQDVAMEEAVLLRLPPWPQMRPWIAMPAIDRRINDRGVMVDLPLVRGLAKAAAVETARLDGEMAELTSGAVPRTTNVESLKEWLVGKGVPVPLANEPKPDGDDEDESGEDETDASRKSKWKLRKGDIADLMARTDVPEEGRLALALRAEAAKASTAKLKAMLAIANPEWRLMGPLVLGGAQQTMRFSGTAWQAHNLIRDVFANPDEIAETNGLNAKADAAEVKRLCDVALTTAIGVGRSGDADFIRTMYETIRRDAQGRSYRAGVVQWISRMMRRVICAPGGYLLLNADWAQIEARITVWLSQQLNMLAAYASGEDVYRIAAAGIFRTAFEMITKLMRQTGKVTILAAGFGGGPDALTAMALAYGILMSKHEAIPVIKGFRESNTQTVVYWYATDDAAAWAVQYPGREFPVPPLGLVSYVMKDNCLRCRLPSGRELRYWQPRLHQEYWSDGRPKQRLSLSGLAVKGRAVFRRSLYHTILVENQVQAIGADMLCCALANMDEAGIPVTLHVHDSVAAEAREDDAESLLPAFKQCMLAMPAWTKGLPVAVDCDISARFG